MKLIIEDDEGHKRVVPLVDHEVTIGRDQSNTIPLEERNISRHHARLSRQNGHVLVEDLGSYNGIFINGQRVRSAVPVHSGDVIRIGDYGLQLIEEGAQVATTLLDLPNAEPQDATADAVAVADTLGEMRATAPQTLLDVPSAETPTDTPILDGLLDGQGQAETAVDLRSPPPPPVAHRATSLIRVEKRDGVTVPLEVESLDAAQSPRLVVLNTSWAGREFACIRTDLTLGRSDEDGNDISLDHRSLSRVHAKLTRAPSGEWRVHDLQSANGVLVNGEQYAEATLSGGDVITLGHVQLKFLMPGDRFKFVPPAERGTTVGRRVAQGMGAVVLLALLTVLGWQTRVGRMVLLKGLDRTGIKLAFLNGLSPDGDEPVIKAEAEPAVPLDTLGTAEKALAGHDFEGAVASLSNYEAPDDVTAERAQGLLHRAQLEVEAKKRLSAAEQALQAGRTTEAKKQLQGVKTEMQQEQLALLQGKVGSPASSRPSEQPSPQSAGGDPVKLFKDGREQLRKGNFGQALTVFEQCLKADPQYLHCEAYLGAAYINLGQGDKGALHYRHFSEHAPQHDPSYAPELKTVRQLLKAYDLKRAHDQGKRTARVP